MNSYTHIGLEGKAKAIWKLAALDGGASTRIPDEPVFVDRSTSGRDIGAPADVLSRRSPPVIAKWGRAMLQ